MMKAGDSNGPGIMAEKASKAGLTGGFKPKKDGPGWIMRILSLLGIALVVGLILLFIWGLNFSTEFLAPEENSRELVVVVPEGASSQRIGEVLEEAGAVRSAEAFVWTVKIKSRIKGQPIVLKAGEMTLDPSLPVWKNVDLIVKGNYKLYPFTIPEGKNMYEIAQMIESAGLGSKEDFLALCRDRGFINSLGFSDEDSLEGYLFPDTYNFPKGTALKTIIKTMTDRFWKVWNKYEKVATEKKRARHQVITLASIVEKETGAPQERGIIAGVFWNRLARGMKLQTDPTVVYGLENFSGTITRQDLNTPHPYNTYVIQGLPPGPIANPGEAAINAVINPSVVPYYFFVSKNDGTHQFSETLADHNRAVNKYQRQPQQNTKQRRNQKKGR